MRNDAPAPTADAPPRFTFHVDLGNGIVGDFAEVSGLDQATEQAATHGERQGGDQSTAGPQQPGKVTLRRGLLDQSERVWAEVETCVGTVRSRTILLTLRSATGDELKLWTLQRAYVVKLLGMPGPGAAPIESMELAYASLA